jgi:hypothetical protein
MDNLPLAMGLEKATIVLEKIACSEMSLKQRELAGLSLGMTNTILKKFVKKRFMIIQNVNSRNIRNILTPERMVVINQRTR